MHTDFPPQVDWFLEKPCFESFLKELALFYTPEPLAPDETLDARGEYLSKVIEIVLFPELKRRFIAVRGLVTEKRVVEVADLPGLYRIFERCWDTLCGGDCIAHGTGISRISDYIVDL